MNLTGTGQDAVTITRWAAKIQCPQAGPLVPVSGWDWRAPIGALGLFQEQTTQPKLHSPCLAYPDRPSLAPPRFCNMSVDSVVHPCRS